MFSWKMLKKLLQKIGSNSGTFIPSSVTRHQFACKLVNHEKHHGHIVFFLLWEISRNFGVFSPQVSESLKKNCPDLAVHKGVFHVTFEDSWGYGFYLHSPMGNNTPMHPPKKEFDYWNPKMRSFCSNFHGLLF